MSAKNHKKKSETQGSHAAKLSHVKKSRRPLVLAAVIVCAIIMVVSILLPSLSSIVSGMSSGKKNKEASEATSTTAPASVQSMIETLDERYTKNTSALEDKLAANPGDMATTINLANSYYQWATDAQSYASSDDDQAHVKDLFTKAMNHYDEYLKQGDSVSAKASRAMCQYYLGDTDGGQSALESLVADNASSPLAWYNLATIYQKEGNTQKATDAYSKVLETDAQDAYGLKNTVTSKLSSLTSAAASGSAASTQ